MVSSKSTVSLAFLVQLILEQYGFELLESTYTWRKEWFLGVKEEIGDGGGNCVCGSTRAL